MPEFELRRKRTVGRPDDWIDSVQVAAGASTRTVIASRRARGGNRAKLAAIGNAVAPGGEPYITWTLYVNGIPDRDYQGKKGQWAAPYDPAARLPKAIPLDTGDLVEIVVDSNSDGSNAYQCDARILIEYEDFDE